jgi:molybdopterin-containing oxidoreductase family iron-sulfur binding subunit
MDLVNIRESKPRAPQAASGRTYWRSLDEKLNTPEFRRWVTEEFAGGTEWLDSNSRRDVLKLMAASFGLAGMVACRRPEEKILPVSRGVEDVIPGKPVYYSTAYVHRGAANGVRVEVHDGRPTKIEGNPLHPASQGAASAFAQASVLSLYDPDRAKTPHRGNQPVTWADWDKFCGEHCSGLGAGAGLRFLVERDASPTLQSIRAKLAAKYPESKWTEYDAIDAGNAIAGAEMAFGQRLQPHYRLDQADVVLSLDDDFLGLDAPAVDKLKAFSKRRRVSKPGDVMNRLYVVESQFSITGAMSDHRLRTRTSDVARIASMLANELGAAPALQVLPGAASEAQKWVAAAARDLKKAGARAVVTAGPRQSAQVHALVALMNQSLGNTGGSVVYTKPVFEPAHSVTALIDEMKAGQVSTLFIAGLNPVYSFPRAWGFKEALAKVKTSIYIGAENDETAAGVSWHLPMAHYLETWGDSRALDGTVTIQQPMVRPLYDGRSAIEVLAQCAAVGGTHTQKKGYDLVRETWLGQLGENGARVWGKALAEGVVPGTAFAEVKPAAGSVKGIGELRALPAEGLEVVFLPGASTDDGRFANNAWMQEAPEPMTKLVWDNAALIAPKTAAREGVKTGDVVQLTAAGRTLEIPVMVAPGQAEDSLAIALGYGRTRAGRVGQNVGFNANLLRGAEPVLTGVKLAKTGRRHALVTTQEHHTMEEPMTGKMRPVVREGTQEQYKADPHFVKEMVHMPEMFDLQGVHDYSKGYQWGMVIDLNACVGCNACLIACNAENNIPVVGKQQVSNGREMHWIRMDRYYTGSEEDPQAVMQPLQCQQCEAAPCENVCPVAATVHSPEGLNDMAYNRCVGTRYCANNCPYKVRRFNYLNWHEKTTPVQAMVHNPDVTVRMRGIMEKCTYCTQRIQEKKILAKTEGRRKIADLEILTACQQTCPAEAITFGNINDPASLVSQLRKQDRNYTLLEEINTKPRTTFLAKLRNPNPELAPAIPAGAHDGHSGGGHSSAGRSGGEHQGGEKGEKGEKKGAH